MEHEEETYVTEVEGSKSPLLQALRAHFTKHYNKDGSVNTNPYGSRNLVNPPLNLDLMNSTDIVELLRGEADATEEG